MSLLLPLFLQTAEYRAQEDRLLTGAMLYPDGGTIQRPRPGIRPMATDVNGVEQALRVTDAGSGSIFVAPGAAFVPADDIFTVNGVYLVVNDAVATVASAWTAGQTTGLYLEVVDPEDSKYFATEPKPAGAVKWTIAPSAQPPSEASLLVATIDATSASPVITMGQYTTAHGGVLPVASKSSLTPDPALLLNAPNGSQAITIDTSLLYTRTKRGWEAEGTVRMGVVEADRPQSADAYPGELFYTQDRDLLQIYLEPEQWTTTGWRPGLAKRVTGPSNDWDRRARVSVPTDVAAFDLAMDVTNTYRTRSQINGALPDNVLEVEFQVHSTNALVMVVLGTEIEVLLTTPPAPPALPHSGCYGVVALQLLGFKNQAWITEPRYPFVDWGEAAYYLAGTRNSANDDILKARTLYYSLDPGHYKVRPMFLLMPSRTGDTTAALVKIKALSIDVTI